MKSKLLRNSGWNLAGQAAPMVVALVSVPLLIAAIGDARFGFLSIAWMLIGYFGVLDLGIGRALTHAVAKRLAENPNEDTSDLTGSGLGMLVLLGVVAALLLLAASRWAVHDLIKVPEGLRPEALRALRVLAAALPFVLLAAGLRGLLEARQAFQQINYVQIPMGILLFAAPLLVIQFTVTLPAIILSLVLVRIANCFALLAMCTREMAGFLRLRLSGHSLRELLRFGGWMTVSNVVSPVMVNMDRLFIGARLAVAEVTYYVTPFEVVSKLLIIPSAIANAAFPEFSRLAKLGAHAEIRRHLARSLALAMALLVPPALLAALLAHPLLAWWIGPELADRSAGIMRLLALGVVINGASYIPFVYVQGSGRSDVTAKFHMIELVLYVPTLLLGIAWYGLLGVAVAWVLRVALDASLLYGYTWSQMRKGATATPDDALSGPIGVP